MKITTYFNNISNSNITNSLINHLKPNLEPISVDYSNEVLANQIYGISIILFILSIMIPQTNSDNVDEKPTHYKTVAVYPSGKEEVVGSMASDLYEGVIEGIKKGALL